MPLDRKMLNDIQRKVENSFRDIEDQYGVKLRFKGGSIAADWSNAILKLEVASLAEDGRAITKEAQAFLDLAHTWGLSPDDLGRTFVASGKTLEIIGARPRAAKPIMAKEVGSKSNGFYPFAPEVISLYLKTGSPSAASAKTTPPSSVKGKRSEKDILNDIRSVENELSPENLTCDGEADPKTVVKLRRLLESKRRNLIAELGRRPTDEELYGRD